MAASTASPYPEANSAGFDCQLGELNPSGFSKFRNNSLSASHADLRDREDELGEDQFITQVLLEQVYLWAPTDANVASPASIDTPWSVESPSRLYRVIRAVTNGNTVHIFDPAASNGRYQSFDHIHFAAFRDDLSSGYKTGIEINVETARQLGSFSRNVPSASAEDDALQALLVPFLPFDEFGTLTCEASDVAVSKTEELVVRIDGAGFREIRPLAIRIESRSVPEGRNWTIWDDDPFPGEFTDDVGNDLTGLNLLSQTTVPSSMWLRAAIKSTD